MSEYDTDAERLIPAEFHMISGSRDSQTSADVSNVAAFQLPDPKGRSGGACTSALLQVLYNNNIGLYSSDGTSMSWVDILLEMRGILGSQGYDQIPQLTSSRLLNVRKDFELVQEEPSGGEKYAVLVGINYIGQNGELSGCHNDVGNIKKYLQEKQGFQDHNITVLMDDGYNIEPTRENIMYHLEKLTRTAVAGDSVFFHYSGHGGRLPDENGDEADGYDETLIPVDFQSAGQIRDDTLYREFVTKMQAGVLVTCLMDCCHSGTVLDLPYKFMADGETEEMERDTDFDMGSMLSTFLLFSVVGDVVGMGAAAFGGGGGGGYPGDGGGYAGGGEDDDCCGLCGCINELLSGGGFDDFDGDE